MYGVSVKWIGVESADLIQKDSPIAERMYLWWIGYSDIGGFVGNRLPFLVKERGIKVQRVCLYRE